MTYHKPIFFFTAVTLCLLAGTGSLQAFKGMGSSQPGSERESMTAVAAQHQGNQNVIVARVNGADITMGPLMSSVMDVKMQKYGGKEVTKEIARNIRQEALEQITLEELAWQKAQALGVSKNDEEVNARVRALIAGAGGEEAFKKNLIAQNKTLETLKQDIQRYIAIRKTIKIEIDDKVVVDEKEINQLYEETKEQFIIPERMMVSDIVFFLDPEDETSQKKVNSIREKIINELNNNLDALPQEGFIIKKELKISKETAPALYNAAINMEQGDISPPVIIDSTFHLVKLEHYQPVEKKPEEEIKAYIGAKLKSRKKDLALTAWRQDLLKDAHIEIVHEILQ